ncbi:IclR family transcriptional regulator [Streptomyces sp. SID3343]|uniref:IclR family transcriptional regulator n=1 Tax=Streptomyces sp. SID3343 TaxID=2690260 RepID=UPI00136DBA52|nr:IclR family transcriptional regulator [Streptomyces sp. SID3343]MYW01026.1 helix-turn-helix domain-containing protein [Streptomyces sp. SID3343]
MSDDAPSGVLVKALAVLQAFTVEDTTLGFAELQRRTDFAKSTLHRVLRDLVAARLLDRVQGRYRLSGLVFELGMRASVERRLLEVATPFIEDLYVRTHELVHLGTREGTEVVYVAKIGGHQQADSPSRLGGRMPLHATALGKVLLAHAPADVREAALRGPLERKAPRTITHVDILTRQLSDIAASGIAFEYEESAVGIVCVAAGIFGPTDEIVAAVSVTGRVHRLRPARYASSVRAAAAGISATLGRRAKPRNH